jgi:hypothetical protein
MNIPQNLMTCSLMHFEQGVPIDDLDIRTEHKRRLARVSHVYWIWKRNPLLETFALFKQLIKGQYADPPSEYRAAQKDEALLRFVIDRIATPSRRQDEAVVRAAAEQAIRIGMETDNVNALVKGGNLLKDVAHLDEPESEQADMSKVMFLPPVITTSVKEVDNTKEDVDDAEMKRIMAKYGGFVDEKEKDIDEMVEVMAAKRGTTTDCNE